MMKVKGGNMDQQKIGKFIQESRIAHYIIWCT